MKNEIDSYYAVIFTSVRTDIDDGYSEMSKQLQDLAKDQPGYLGFESASGELNISISYWRSLEDIANWKANVTHAYAQSRHADWYEKYRVRICKVEKDYGRE